MAGAGEKIKIMHPSKILLFVLLSFIGGVFISSFIAVPAIIIYEILFLGVFYLVIAWFVKKQPVFRKAVIIFGVCLVILVLGFCQGTRAKPFEYDSFQQGAGHFSFLRQKFQAVIDKNLSPPQSQVLSAILIGNKSDISKKFKEKLNVAGVRHITAISGMHKTMTP